MGISTIAYVFAVGAILFILVIYTILTVWIWTLRDYLIAIYMTVGLVFIIAITFLGILSGGIFFCF